MFRLTPEMLLDCPFISGLDSGELVEVFSAEGLDSMVTLSEVNDESNASSYSKKWSFVSDEGSAFFSWSDGEEINSITSSTVTTRDIDAFNPLAQVLSNTLQWCPPICSIPVGA